MLTDEQKVERERIAAQLRSHYDKKLALFFRTMAFDLSEEMLVLTTAYGVNRIDILLQSMKDFLAKEFQNDSNN